MMKVGIMQPYLFPYIGYWQLLYAVDKYVILDDVNYITRGYINRNNILINGKANRFTVPVLHASQNRLISETKLNFQSEEKKSFLDKVRFSYKKAPHFSEAYKLIEAVVMNDTNDLTDYIAFSIELIKEYLQIATPIYKSSRIEKNPELKAQDRIIAICKSLGGDTYINPSGGRQLYSHEKFVNESLNLFFLDTMMDKIVYKQFNNDFVNYLSIIDVLMFNDVPSIQEFLTMYELNK